MKILIVEDNPLIATAIERAGAQLRFTADHATDGWDAIGMLENEEYAAIVIDSDLPRQSGYGVLTYLREEVGSALANVLVLTSSDEDSIRRKVDGGVSVMTTTDEVDALARAMRAACGRNDEE